MTFGGSFSFIDEEIIDETDYQTDFYYTCDINGMGRK